MKIHKVTASFGKLQHDTLTFQDGLNIIYAPNESGKSTWCAFIRAMLYGIDSSERARAGYLPDKQRYVPWSGSPMEGTMELSSGDRDITLTRTTKNSSAPMREFSAVYTGTAAPVEGLTGTNAGPELTGVSAGVFRRTAFVEQGTIAISGSAELEKRIASIVSSGEEATSYSETDSRLRTWLRRRRYNKKGALPDLERRMDDIENTLSGMDHSVTDAAQLEQELEAAKAECERLEIAMTESRKIQRRNALTRMTEGRAEIERKNKEHERAIADLSASRHALYHSFFADRNPKDVQLEAEHDLNEYKKLRPTARQKMPVSPYLSALFFLTAVICFVLYVSTAGPVYLYTVGLSLLLGIILLVHGLRSRSVLLSAKKRCHELLMKYHASSPEDILRLVEEHQRLTSAVAEATVRESEARLSREDAHLRQAKIEDVVLGDLDFVDGSSEAARLSRHLAQERARVVSLTSQLASLNGKMQAFGDAMTLRSELTVIEEKHSRYEQEYEAIELALDVLKEADDEIQSRFSPELGRLASEYMARMTGGRYQKVLIDRDFSAMTRTDLDPIARSSEYLSAGTLDLMYLAVRLAVCELALPSGEPCPLIIDDALVNLDETRSAQAMELLREIGKHRQVILFTCRQP